MRLTEVLNFVESIIENGKENNLGALKVSKGVCDFIDILRDQQCITKDSLKNLEYLLDYIPDIMDGKKNYARCIA